MAMTNQRLYNRKQLTGELGVDTIIINIYLWKRQRKIPEIKGSP